MADIPFGTIVMFHGVNIPHGWLLCNGDNDTPNLSDRFILAAAGLSDVGKYNKSTFSGAGKEKAYHGITANVQITINGATDKTTLTLDQIPAHKHTGGFSLEHENWGYYGTTPVNFAWYHFDGVGNTYGHLAFTSTEGGGKPHEHHIGLKSDAHDHTLSLSPPYYILAFIIYVG